MLKRKATPQGAPIRLAEGGPLRTDAPLHGDGFSSAAPSASPPSAPTPEDEPGDTVVEFAADSVDAQGKRHKATKRVVLTRLQSAALDAFGKEWRKDWGDLFPDKIFAPERITELLKDRHFLNAAYARLRAFDAMRGVVRFEAGKQNAAPLDGETRRSGRNMALTNWIDDPEERRRFSAWLRRSKPELFEGQFAGGALAEDRALFHLSDQDYVRFAAETALAERLQIASLNTIFQEHLARAQGVGDAVGETVIGGVDLAQTAGSGLRGAVLDNPSLGGSSSALRGRNFALLMAYSSAVVEAKATGRSLAEITQRDVENWRGFEKAAEEGAQRLAVFASAPLDEQLSTLGELGQAGAKALIGELTRLVSGPGRRAEREAALRAQRRSGEISQSEYLEGLRAITRQAAADAILVLEIGVPGSQAFRAAKALKLLQGRRRGGDGPDGMGGLQPALAGVTPSGRIKIAPNDVFGLGGPRIVESRGKGVSGGGKGDAAGRDTPASFRFPQHPTERQLLELSKGGRLDVNRIVGSNGQLYELRGGRYHDAGPASVADAERSGAVLHPRNWGRLRGIEFERAYRAHIRAARNREPFVGEASDGRAYTVIPDVVEEGLFHEAKSTGRFRLSPQVQAMADAANNSGGRLRLVIDKNTPLPKSDALKERLSRHLKIELYVFDPGPPPDLREVDLKLPRK